MDYITFTDHDTLEAHEILGWNCEKLVSGPEMSVSDLKFAGRTLHINVSELDIEEFIEHLGNLGNRTGPESYVRYLKRHRLPYIYNHPFWFEFGQEPNLNSIPKLAKLFPVLRADPKNQ